MERRVQIQKNMPGKKTAKKKGQAVRKHKGETIVCRKEQLGSSSAVLLHHQKVKTAAKLNADGLTGVQIAKKMGCSRSQVSRYLQHATKICAEDIAELHDSEVAFQLRATSDLITTIQQNLVYEDKQGNVRVDSAAAGQMINALNRRAKIFGIDKQEKEETSRNGDGDTYQIVMARFEDAVKRGAMKRENIPVLNM